MLRLLCIANPARYATSETDVPLSYARLAAHPDVELYHAETSAMMADSDLIEVTPVPVGFMPDEFRSLPSRPTVALPPGHFDVAFDRTLKPFPDGLYDRLVALSPTLRFVNAPAGIQRHLAPDFLLRAARGRLPPMLLTDDIGEAAAFLAEHGTVVAKRPNSCGGREVFRLSHEPSGRIDSDNPVEGRRGYPDLVPLFNNLTRGGQEPVLLARYLPRVREGDKRIVVVGGDIYGAYLRRAADGHWVQNVSRGGQVQLDVVTDEDRALVGATCGAWLANGINLLGYDLLRNDDGGWLISEVNAGNIGGLFRLEYLGIQGITDRFVDWLARLASAGARLTTAISHSNEPFLEAHR